MHVQRILTNPNSLGSIEVKTVLFTCSFLCFMPCAFVLRLSNDISYSYTCNQACIIVCKYTITKYYGRKDTYYVMFLQHYKKYRKCVLLTKVSKIQDTYIMQKDYGKHFLRWFDTFIPIPLGFISSLLLMYIINIIISYIKDFS